MITAPWSPLHDHPSPSVDILEEWCKTHGITHHEAISIKETDTRGLGVVSSQFISVGTVLCTIPKDSIFSHRTASLPLLLPAPQDLTSTESLLYLTACLLHELRLASQSKWYEWLQMLPRDPVLLPSFWGDSELCGDDGKVALGWLDGSQGGREVDKQNGEGLSLDDLKSYYSTISPYLPSTSTHPKPSPLQAFLYAYSMVSSRTFVINTYITIGMIPFCDMFNHTSTSHLALCTDPWVCASCGSLLRCAHDVLDGEGEVERLQHLSKEYLDQMEVEGSVDTIDMRVERTITTGEEVTFTYDQGISDSKLLVGWGFITGSKTGGGISWSSREILNARTLRAYFALVQDRTLDGLLEGDSEDETGRVKAGKVGEETMSLDANGRVSVNLVVGVGLRCSTDLDLGISESVETVLKTVQELATTTDCEDDSKGIRPTSRRVAQAMVDLFEDRMKVQARPDLSLSEIRAIRAALTEDEPLQAIALDLVISERELLEKAVDSWRSLPS